MFAINVATSVSISVTDGSIPRTRPKLIATRGKVDNLSRASASCHKASAQDKRISRHVNARMIQRYHGTY